MADQTVEIKLILRDELSKQLEPVISRVRELDSAIGGVQQSARHMEALSRATGLARRELSSLAGITLGGLIGGGVIAGITAISNALGDMARQALQLHYTADALGTTATSINKLTDAMTLLGKTRSEGEAAITSAAGKLKTLGIEKEQSALFKELKDTGGKSGIALGEGMIEAVNGPRGVEGAILFAVKQIANMRSPEAAAKFGETLFGKGFGQKAAQDFLDNLGRLPSKLELSIQKTKELAFANASLERSWENIKKSLSIVLLPVFADLSDALSKFLQSESGQKFIDQMRGWGDELEKAIGNWIKGGGLEKAVAGLGEALGYMKTGFELADGVLKQMGVSWPQALSALVGLKFGAWLLSLVAPLTALAGIPNVLKLLPLLMAGAAVHERIKGPGTLEEREAERKRAGKLQPDILKRFNDWWTENVLPKIAPQMLKKPPQDEGKAKTDQEEKADKDERKRADDDLSQSFELIEQEFGKINALLTPGGPEGGKGPSGFGASIDRTGFYPELHEGGHAMLERAAHMVMGETGYSNVAAARVQLETAFNRAADRGHSFRHILSSSAIKNKKGQSIGYYAGSEPGTKGAETYRPEAKPSAEQLEWFKENVWNPTVQGGNESERTMGFLASGNASDQPGNTVASNLKKKGVRWGNVPGSTETFIEASPVSSGRKGIPYSPDVEAFGGPGADVGGSSITSHLAQRDKGMNGSANVDIDVSGILDKMPRKASDMFRKTPNTGQVQMKNNTRPENNPVSFE